MRFRPAHLTLALGLAGSAQAQTLDALQLDGVDQAQAFHSTRSIAQTWTANFLGRVVQVELLMDAVGVSSPDDLIVEILDMNGGDMTTAPVLGSLTFSEGVLGGLPFVLDATAVTATVLDLSPLNVVAQPGDVLAFRLKSTRVLPDLYSTRISLTDQYPGGQYWVDDAALATADAAFKLWVDTCVGPASTAVRNGSGLNPSSFVEVSPPFIGSTWDTSVDVATPGASGSMLAMSLAGPTQGSFLTGTVAGELLILPPYLPLNFSPTGTHSMPVPDDCALLGVNVYAQAGHLVVSSFTLTNALDVTLGNF